MLFPVVSAKIAHRRCCHRRLHCRHRRHLHIHRHRRHHRLHRHHRRRRRELTNCSKLCDYLSQVLS